MTLILNKHLMVLSFFILYLFVATPPSSLPYLKNGWLFEKRKEDDGSITTLYHEL